MECIYCGTPLSESNQSSEHIIQNALGGILESTNICCDKCNNILSKNVDVDFCKIFAPVVTQIQEMNQTSSSAQPSCTGRAICIDDREEYNVIIRGNQVVDCAEYKKKYRHNLSKAELHSKFQITTYDFILDNCSFKKGISKIAINYALTCGIDRTYLANMINVAKSKDEVKDIDFNVSIIPFFPLNSFDRYLDLDVPIELSHTLILFNFKNVLVCYIDLFQTFQHYIILTERWSGEEIYKPFCQVIEKIDRSVPEFNIYRAKHIYTLSTLYGVPPTFDLDKLRKDISTVFQKEPYEKSMGRHIERKISWAYSDSPQYSMIDKFKSITFYMDDNDVLRDGCYRKLTPDILSNDALKTYFYPERISTLIKCGLDIREYTFAKFQRLVSYLLGANKKEE